MNTPVFVYILVMAGVTYAVRMVPFVIFRKKIESKFIKDFLYYVPYAVLGAMTIPAVFYSTGSLIPSIAGLCAAVLLALKNKSLIVVAVAACAAAFVAELVIGFF